MLDAYEQALGLTKKMTACSRKVLQQYGNMSSPTVLFVLNEFMKMEVDKGSLGLMAALGPGFSSESLLLQWQ